LTLTFGVVSNYLPSGGAPSALEDGFSADPLTELGGDLDPGARELGFELGDIGFELGNAHQAQILGCRRFAARFEFEFVYHLPLLAGVFLRSTPGLYIDEDRLRRPARRWSGWAAHQKPGFVMPAPLMPKATAVWLVDNTSLTFEQIADFCGLHPLEIQAIADGEVANQMQGLDPVANGQTTAEEIARCQDDPDARLALSPQAMPPQVVKHRGPRYTPIAKRQDKPDAIAFLLRSHPELSDAQISKLIGTTKPTIAAVRDRTHWNSPNIKARHPVGLGLCTLDEMEDAVRRARARLPAAEREALASGEPEALET
jgi:hypothetical protein